MTTKFDELMYQSGLTAQGCWDEMDEYDRTAVMKFAELIVKECAEICLEANDYKNILRHFGVE